MDGGETSEACYFSGQMWSSSEVSAASSSGEPIRRPRGCRAWTANKLRLRRTVALLALACGLAASVLAGWQVKRASE
jgi:hypothetical protein